jgi:hypothetical protein
MGKNHPDLKTKRAEDLNLSPPPAQRQELGRIYFAPRIASFAALATRNLTEFFVTPLRF